MSILLFLVAGFAGGWLLRKKRVSAAASRAAGLTVMILLFSLGTEIGSDAELYAGIGKLGFTGFISALFSVAGSIILGAAFWKIIKK